MRSKQFVSIHISKAIYNSLLNISKKHNILSIFFTQDSDFRLVFWKNWWHNCVQDFLTFKELYMSSSFCLLGVESSDFSQAEKERTSCRSEQIHKMTIFFLTQDRPRLLFWVKIGVILWICSELLGVLSFSAWEKSRDWTPNSQKLEDM